MAAPDGKNCGHRELKKKETGRRSASKTVGERGVRFHLFKSRRPAAERIRRRGGVGGWEEKTIFTL